jgi:TetR/AcrR family transcriptional regulator, regulator of autoinduction and epiphytic fitness
MKAKDGRVARGNLIREEVREKILNAYIELLRQGIPRPTARQIAKNAGLSLRVIFKRFTDLSEVQAIAIARIEARARSFFLRPSSADLSAAQGLQLFISQQTRMFEEIAPFRRVALQLDRTDPLIAATSKRIRAVAMEDIRRAVRPTLDPLSAGERRKLLLALHMVCAWPSWETLRSHQGLGRSATRDLITHSALAILNAALRKSQGSARPQK